MQPRTVEVFERLDKAQWFACVGKEEKNVVVLPSWKDAFKHCGAPEWQSVCLEARNRIGDKLLVELKQKDRYNQWNDIINDVTTPVAHLVKRKVQEVATETRFPEVCEKVVCSNIRLACLESEYADIYPPGFFSDLAEWYQRPLSVWVEGQVSKGKASHVLTGGTKNKAHPILSKKEGYARAHSYRFGPTGASRVVCLRRSRRYEIGRGAFLLEGGNEVLRITRVGQRELGST